MFLIPLGVLSGWWSKKTEFVNRSAEQGIFGVAPGTRAWHVTMRKHFGLPVFVSTASGKVFSYCSNHIEGTDWLEGLGKDWLLTVTQLGLLCRQLSKVADGPCSGSMVGLQFIDRPRWLSNSVRVNSLWVGQFMKSNPWELKGFHCSWYFVALDAVSTVVLFICCSARCVPPPPHWPK